MIGFKEEFYTYTEPERWTLISNVTLVKENNRQSKQTFSVAVGISSPNLEDVSLATARVGGKLNDYDIAGAPNGFLTFLFPPTLQRTSYFFPLNPDDVAEGTEVFLALSTPIEGSITYMIAGLSSSIFRSVRVVIEDDDRKHCGDVFYCILYEIYCFYTSTVFYHYTINTTITTTTSITITTITSINYCYYTTATLQLLLILYTSSAVTIVKLPQLPEVPLYSTILHTTLLHFNCDFMILNKASFFFSCSFPCWIYEGNIFCK